MSLKIQQAAILSVVIVFGFGFCESTVMAQGDGQTGGTPVVPTVTPEPVAPRGVASTTSQNTEGVGDLGSAVTLDTEVIPIEDFRNQGFIGATASRIQDFGFVGRPGQLLAPPLTDGATFGGGVNDSSNSTVNIGGGNAGRATGGFGATGNGVTITRQNIRSHVRANFSAPKMSPQQVTSRFDRHFGLQPGIQTQGRTYSINVQDRTATLSGSVNTTAERDRLERQLRLEPGVYKIVNQLQVLN